MHLATIGIRLLEALFFTGLIGSCVVVLISFLEDARELRGDEPPKANNAQDLV